MQYSEWKHAQEVEVVRAKLAALSDLWLNATDIPVGIAGLGKVELVRHEDPLSFHDAVWAAYTKSDVDILAKIVGDAEQRPDMIQFSVDKDQAFIEYYEGGRAFLHVFKGLRDLDLDLM